MKSSNLEKLRKSIVKINFAGEDVKKEFAAQEFNRKIKKQREAREKRKPETSKRNGIFEFFAKSKMKRQA